MEPDGTLFFRSRRFKWLRYYIAAFVICFYFGIFFYNMVIHAYYVSQNGPFASSSAFAFGFNELIVALIPATILISELEVLARPKTYRLLRAICIVVGVMAMLSGCFFLHEIKHLLDFKYFKIDLAAHILRQVLIVFATTHLYHSIIIREPKVDAINA